MSDNAEALEQKAGKSGPMGMRRSHEALLSLALALCAGCGSITEAPAANTAVPPMDADAALATAQQLVREAGVQWEDSPTTVMIEVMSYEQANARLGRDLEYPDPETRSMAVWLAAFSGRYGILPQLQGYDVVGPYEDCVNVIFDTAGKLIDMGSGCPGPLPTPTATATLTPTLTATPLPTATIEPTPTRAFWAVQEPDFGFRFENLSCYNDILDTFEGTFTTDVGYPELTAVTVPMHLTDEQITAVYMKMVEIGFWDYPANFAVPLPPWGRRPGYMEPQPHYRITVRNAGVEQWVDWLIQYVKPTNRDAEQLKSLIIMITEMIRSSPDYQQVPDHGYGCA